MTATSSDAESLREQCDHIGVIESDPARGRARCGKCGAIATFAQPASSDLRAAVHDLIIDAWQSETPNEALAAADALLDTAQPDLRRTPIDVERLARALAAEDEGKWLSESGYQERAAVIADAYAKLAATPAPAEEQGEHDA